MLTYEKAEDISMSELTKELEIHPVHVMEMNCWMTLEEYEEYMNTHTCRLAEGGEVSLVNAINRILRKVDEGG